MIVVVDASVALKWFFRLRHDEDDVEHALTLLRDIGEGRHRMVQPPHFLAEMAVVLVRKKSRAAQRDFADLQDLDWDTLDGSDLYVKAMELSNRFGHHLFDTLYHTTALLMPDSVLVTADRTYYRKAKPAGQISLLKDLEQLI